jgi:hypothetical protein
VPNPTKKEPRETEKSLLCEIEALLQRADALPAQDSRLESEPLGYGDEFSSKNLK